MSWGEGDWGGGSWGSIGLLYLGYLDSHGNGESAFTDRTLSLVRTTDTYGSGESAYTNRTLRFRRNVPTHGEGYTPFIRDTFYKYVTADSYMRSMHTNAVIDKTSLELTDFDLTFDYEKLTWYTQWFPEERISGDEYNIGIQSRPSPTADDPVATIHVEYDANGNGDVDERSDPIYVDHNDTVYNVTGIPNNEDGFYRLRIRDYGGYNDIITVLFGFVH